MNRKFAVFAALVAAFLFASQGAQAGEGGTKLKAVQIGVGAAATAGYFAIGGWKWDSWRYNSGITRLGASAITTMGCAALTPMVATVVLNRPLTMREGHVVFADCLLPFIGGWLVNQAYDAHPEWEPGKPVRHHKKKA
ncbi:MAG TPA: hypothetical protein VGC38_07915 [Pseudolabrys sp.]